MKRALVSAAPVSIASLLTVPFICAAAEPAAPVANEPSAIVIYDQPNFQGRSATINAATPDLTALNFNDRVASFAIKGANDWVLCENRNYGGRCVRVQSQAQDLNVLRMQGRVSSLYSAPPVAAAPTTP